VLGGIDEVHARALELTVWMASPLVAAQPHCVNRAQSQHPRRGQGRPPTASSGCAAMNWKWPNACQQAIDPDLSTRESIPTEGLESVRARPPSGSYERR
jgi:hypothetical protein